MGIAGEKLDAKSILSGRTEVMKIELLNKTNAGLRSK